MTYVGKYIVKYVVVNIVQCSDEDMYIYVVCSNNVVIAYGICYVICSDICSEN